MNKFNIDLSSINKFIEKKVFEILDVPNDISVNVRVELTGVAEYIFMGESRPTIKYTMYVLPTNEISDALYGLRGDYFGRDIEINTRSAEYQSIRVGTNRELESFLKYFSINNRVICTRVVNEIDRQFV